MKNLIFIKELRSFLLLWGSQKVSELGTAMTSYALIIWIYEQKGTASSITLLTICSFFPTIFFRFIAGTLADRWNKKRIMLCTDLIAAFGTIAVLVLFSFSALMVCHLYVINILLSFMNALQNPASFVATSLLVPKKYYTRACGLQSLSGSAISILAPALGSCLLAFGGMTVVLVCDLVSFSAAFFTLLFFIKIPETKHPEESAHAPFLKSCLEGIHYLWERSALLRITLFVAIINFLAKLGNDGMIAPFVLGRTNNNQQALGMVQSAVALGLLATMVTPPQKKGGDRPMRRPTPKLQWEGTGLTRHCLSYPRSFWQTVSRPSHCGVRFAQVEKRTTTHTRVTKQAEWQWAAAGAG